jgi:hypothetical protein
VERNAAIIAEVAGVSRKATNGVWRALGFGGRNEARQNEARQNEAHRGPPRPPRDRSAGRSLPRHERRPDERPQPPASLMRDLARRQRARAPMDFAAGVASGVLVLLALAGVALVLFPYALPRPAETAEQTGAAASPSAVAPSLQPEPAPPPRSAPGRGDAMSVTANLDPPAAGGGAPAMKATPPATPAAKPVAAPPQRSVEDPTPMEQVSLAGAHAIYLSSFPDRELAESGWQILERRYAKGLTGLKPEIVEGKDAGGKRVWRLFAGPLRSQADAAQRCRALSFGSVNCKPADFTRGGSGATGAWEG